VRSFPALSAFPRGNVAMSVTNPYYIAPGARARIPPPRISVAQSRPPRMVCWVGRDPRFPAQLVRYCSVQ
jgi:hypothetical protein